VAVMQQFLEGEGREVLAHSVILGACFESMTLAATKKMSDSLKTADAILALTCASGMKTLTHLHPGMPVIQPVDTVGHGAIFVTPMDRDRYDHLIAYSPCVSCEHCVISYTGGICPVTTCPAKSMYGPCERAPRKGDEDGCALDPERSCTWLEIEKNGWDLQSLKDLEHIHMNYGIRPLSYGGRAAVVPSPEWLRRLGGWFLSIIPQSWSKIAQYLF
jgi:hypothetical protein